jgi:hypothetical protein
LGITIGDRGGADSAGRATGSGFAPAGIPAMGSAVFVFEHPASSNTATTQSHLRIIVGLLWHICKTNANVQLL